MDLFPNPYEMESNDELFTFSPCQQATAAEGADYSLIKELWNNFTFSTGNISITPSLKANKFIIGGNTDIEVKPGYDYALSVTKEGIAIAGKNETGLVHGIVSLLQMIFPVCLDDGNTKFAVNCCTVHDKPAMNFRSIHICVFPQTTLAFLQKCVRMCGFLKYSHIIIEFWGMLKYTCMPELAWDNAFSKEQIRPIIHEANQLGMEVIPMFNHLGHATQSRGGVGKHVVLDQNPKKALLFEPDGWTWCLSNPQTIALLKQIRQEQMELCGKGSYYHLGCDEAYTYATCHLCKDKDKSAMLAQYLNSLADELKSCGRRGIIWGDMLLDRVAWDKKYITSTRCDLNTHEILDKLDRSLIIADWQYDITEAPIETSSFFMQKGFDVLICPWDDQNNIRAACETAKQFSMLGVMGTTWHTLNSHFKTLVYNAISAWSANYPKTEYCHITENVASMQRRLLPSSGIYDNSGWMKSEIQP